MYDINYTQPDIGCAISKLSRYTSNTYKNNWMEMKRALVHLDDTQKYDLHYNKFTSVVMDSDANWITSSTEMKSTSRYDFTIGG